MARNLKVVKDKTLVILVMMTDDLFQGTVAKVVTEIIVVKDDTLKGVIVVETLVMRDLLIVETVVGAIEMKDHGIVGMEDMATAVVKTLDHKIVDTEDPNPVPTAPVMIGKHTTTTVAAIVTVEDMKMSDIKCHLNTTTVLLLPLVACPHMRWTMQRIATRETVARIFGAHPTGTRTNLLGIRG